MDLFVRAHGRGDRPVGRIVGSLANAQAGSRCVPGVVARLLLVVGEGLERSHTRWRWVLMLAIWKKLPPIQIQKTNIPELGHRQRRSGFMPTVNNTTVRPSTPPTMVDNSYQNPTLSKYSKAGVLGLHFWLPGDKTKKGRAVF